MANRIDIRSFEGVITNADQEDLRPEVLTALKNLRPVNGKLVKTFGAGEFTDIPAPVIDVMSTKLGETYTVRNVFVFNSVYLSTTEAHQHRYIVVATDDTSKNTRILWWDYDVPAVSNCLVFTDNALFFSTSAAHKIDEDDYVMIQDVKNNDGAAITGCEIFDQAGSQSDADTVYINSPSGFGGTWMDDRGELDGEIISAKPSMGGKLSRHLQLNTITVGSDQMTKVGHIAIVEVNGGSAVVTLAAIAKYSDGFYRLFYSTDGVNFTALATSEWSGILSSNTNIHIHQIRAFNNSFYVAVEHTKSPTNYTSIVKVTPTWSASVVTWADTNPIQLAQQLSACQMVDYTQGGSNYLMILMNDGTAGHLYRLDTSDTATDYTSGLPSAHKALYLCMGLDSDGKENFFISGASSGTVFIDYCRYDRLGNSAPWSSISDSIITNAENVIAMDGYKHQERKTAIVCLEDTTANTHKVYTIKEDGSFGLTLLNSTIPTDSQTDGKVIRMYGTHATPGGNEYLYISYDTYNDGTQHGGSVFTIAESGTHAQITLCDAGADFKGKSILSFGDVSTVFSMTYAKAHMVLYGAFVQGTGVTEEETTVFRHSDVGWATGTWSGNGSLKYNWRDLLGFFDISGDFKQENNRNPIVPMGDSIRFLPGVLSDGDELWIGHIDRELLGGNVTYADDFYGLINTITNPFTINGAEGSESDKEIRGEDGLKYNITAIYDGIQESLLDNDKTIVVEASELGTDDISKTIIRLSVKIDTSSLDKRITGINIYRAGRLSTASFGSYSLIAVINLLTGYDDTLPLEAQLHALENDRLWIKDKNAALLDQACEVSTRTFGMKITGAFNGKIKEINKRNTTVNDMKALIYDSTDTLQAGVSGTATTLNVSDASNFTVGEYIVIHGLLTNTEIYPSDHEVIEIVTIDTSLDTLVVTRAKFGTSPASHSSGDRIYIHSNIMLVNLKAGGTGATRSKAYNVGWKIYVAASWNIQSGYDWNGIESDTSGVYGGSYVCTLRPLYSEPSGGGQFDMTPWQTSGSVDLSKAAGKTFIGNDSTNSKDITYIVVAAGSYNSDLGYGFAQFNDGLLAGDVTIDGTIVGSVQYDSQGGGVYIATITDNGLPAGAYHYNEGEDSINTSGKFGKVFKGRMFLFNLRLDIGDENEEHRDWLSYSELEQFDVRSVSNVIGFPDKEGGEGTGMAELFGRLLLFKPQAIFTLDVVDPTDPATWRRRESKHNIGNIAPQGVVEAIDSVYFVFRDGIYRLDPNFAAAADATPSKLNRITEPIRDIFEGIDDKTIIKGAYDQNLNEVVYKWVRSSSQEVWAYNVHDQAWRQLDTAGAVDMYFHNEDNYLNYYDETAKKIHTFNNTESSTASFKTMRFPVGMDRKTKIRHAAFQYDGQDTITVNVYVNGETTPSTTHTLTGSGRQIRKVPLKRYANSVQLEIESAASTNTLEFERLQLETE